MQLVHSKNVKNNNIEILDNLNDVHSLDEKFNDAHTTHG